MWRYLLCVLAILHNQEYSFAKVAVELESQPIAVKTSSYTARIEADGCLPNLLLNGIQFLAPGVNISRGSYFYQGKPLELPNVKRLEGNVVEAAGEAAAIRYVFDDQRMTWHLTNKTSEELVFFIVLNGYVGAVSTNESDLQKTPLNDELTQAEFFAGDEKLKIEGFDKLWGPWHGPHQVVQTTLKPTEKKTLKLQIGKASIGQRLQILKLKAAREESALTITSPREYQVIQRSSKEFGQVLISGHTRQEFDSVEIRLVGEHLRPELQQWRQAKIQPFTRQFSAQMKVPAGGWYRLESRATTNGKAIAKNMVQHFGVGEVFVGAGQSNSTNSGQFKTKQTTGMVSSFSGSHWQLADDPQPGVADRTQGGSFWPAFGDAMYKKFGVPIGVATTGYGGTSVNQWQPDGDLFQRWMITRVHQLGPQGFRALLWHQGESDITMPEKEYYAKLKNTIDTSVRSAGWEFPWFVALASYHSAQKLRFENVRGAQKKLCSEGVAILGPDTDLLTGDHRDFDGKGIHFSPKGLKAHGEMWAEKVTPYIEAQLDDSRKNKELTAKSE